MSRLVMSCHVISRLLTSCHVLSYHVMSCHVASSHVLSRPVISCHVTSCHVISRLLTSCHIMSCHVMSCHVILLENLAPETSEPSKFFYYGGGVAATRFSKPWPCAGIRLGATLSLWRRVHCVHVAWQACGMVDLGIVSRGRLRGSGVLEVCRGCAAGLPQVCRGSVLWGLGSGRVLYTHGQRAFRVAGCGDRACWGVCRGCVAALCRGDWGPGLFFTRMANVRFAWQAAGIVRAGRCVAVCVAALCRGDWVPGALRARMT